MYTNNTEVLLLGSVYIHVNMQHLLHFKWCLRRTHERRHLAARRMHCTDVQNERKPQPVTEPRTRGINTNTHRQPKSNQVKCKMSHMQNKVTFKYVNPSV